MCHCVFVCCPAGVHVVNEEKVVPGGEGAHHLHCTAPGMAYAVTRWLGVHRSRTGTEKWWLCDVALL